MEALPGTDYYQFSFDHGNRSSRQERFFPSEETGDPKEELLGDCIEIRLGILRVALMYEGCGVDLFGWGSIVEILTGLEHSLLVFNASTYPSGLRNRKIGSSKKSKKSYSYDNCLDVPTEGVPLSKSPILTINEITSNETDVEITDATEGTGFGAAAPSTEVGPSSSFVASGDEAAKRSKLTPLRAAARAL